MCRSCCNSSQFGDVKGTHHSTSNSAHDTVNRDGSVGYNTSASSTRTSAVNLDYKPKHGTAPDFSGKTRK